MNGKLCCYLRVCWGQINISIEILYNFLFVNRVDWEGDIVKAHSKDKMSTVNSTNVPSGGENATTSSGKVSQRREEFTIIYSCIILFGIVTNLCRSFSYYYVCLRISINVHDMFFRSVSRAKMIFFNANPSGRILNRFAKDMNKVDNVLPSILLGVFDVSEFFFF